MRLTTLEVKTCASASVTEGGLGRYSRLEKVGVRCVSNGRLYHDHLETQVGSIAARQDLGLAGPNGVKKQDRVVRFPKNKYVWTVRKQQVGKRSQTAPRSKQATRSTW